MTLRDATTRDYTLPDLKSSHLIKHYVTRPNPTILDVTRFHSPSRDPTGKLGSTGHDVTRHASIALDLTTLYRTRPYLMSRYLTSPSCHQMSLYVTLLNSTGYTMTGQEATTLSSTLQHVILLDRISHHGTGPYPTEPLHVWISLTPALWGWAPFLNYALPML